MRIAEVVQQQNTAIENSRVLMNGLVEEVSAHRDNFQKVALVMQVYEQHIVRSGAATQEMAQYINALIKENEQKSLLIGSLMKEYQAQAEVLRQHHIGTTRPCRSDQGHYCWSRSTTDTTTARCPMKRSNCE